MSPKTKKKPTKQTGRPPIAAEARRSVMVRVLVTEKEHEELQRAAEAGSLPLSTWARLVVLAAARKATGDSG